MSKYRAMFISETSEHLQSMDQGLVNIEQNPQDQDAIAEVFRNAHSIKGMAASMGYEQVRDLAHAMEDLMEEIRDGERQADEPAMDMLFQGLDSLRAMLEKIEADREIPESETGLAAKIVAFQQTNQATQAAATQQPPQTAEPRPEQPPEGIEPATPEEPPEPPGEDYGELEDTGFFSEEQAPVMEIPERPAQQEPKKPASIELDFDEERPTPRKQRRERELDLEEESAAPPIQEPPPPPPPPKRPSQEIEFVFEEERPARKKPEPEPELTAPEPAPEPVVPAPEPPKPVPSGPVRTVRVVLAPQTQAPGVRAMILVKRLEEAGAVVGQRPPMGEVKAGNFISDPKGLAIEVDIVSDSLDQELMKIVNSLTDVAGYDIKHGVSAPLKKEAEPPPEEESAGAGEEFSGAGEGVVQDQGRLEHVYDPFAQVQALPQTVRVKTGDLDQFINSLGEMIMVKSELREVSKRHTIPALEAGLDRLENLVKEFNEQVMSIRMMPLESVVQRLPRVVRDLAKDEGKKVRLELIGQHIELDRAILEQLSDPLIHLLRNCVNHGLEPPDERERLGKPAEGKVVLEAYRLRDLVLIEVRDDGRGMDPAALKETAVRKGRINEDEASAMSDEDAYQLIFQPGFSTAKKVGMISGRGVGMDAVKNVIESLGGFVTLTTQAGKGTTFTLHLPRTIAIVNVLLIRLANETFAIPISKILKTVEILPHQVRKTQGQNFFLDRQELVPMKVLHRFLDLPEPEHNGRHPLPALVVEAHKKKVALLVDELVGQEEAFIRPLGKPLERVSGLSGVTMLGDGRVVFVLDTMSLLY